MDELTKRIIREEIGPKVQNGEITLFLGAGVSIGTPSLNDLGVPSTTQLIERICDVAGYKDDESKKAELQTVFGLGQDDIDNFENFLVSNFKVSDVQEWQKSICRYWWRAIFTTNIDDVIDFSIQALKKEEKDYPDYVVFNYRDSEPLTAMPTSPPVVYLHGSINKINDGFVFNSVSYADNSVRQGDWISKCALHITRGNCLFVGSKFKESDVEVAISQRELWEDLSGVINPNWIVLSSFTNLDKRYYEKRGFVVLKADAEEFFNYLFSQLSYLSPIKFIKRRAPHLINSTDKDSAAWFSENVESVSEGIDKAKRRKGLYSRFYFGDMPDWFYVANEVPAIFSHVDNICKKILDFESSDDVAKLISVVGGVCVGKTTVNMLVGASLSKTHNNIYNYIGEGSIEIGHMWSIIKDTKGLIVIIVDAASEYFYAINELIERVSDSPVSCKLCFLIEERLMEYERNYRHFHKVQPKDHAHYIIDAMSEEDARVLYNKATELGITFETLEGKNEDESAKQIVDFDNGYKGDLLATLYELSSRGSYHEKINDEYAEISDEDSKCLFQTISLVTASRISIPINYLSEAHGLSINKVIRLLKTHLKGKIIRRGVTMTVTARHHSIAEYHIENNFDKNDIKNRIISLAICLSKKFEIEDIKKHPISYRIYRNVLSYRYLTDVIFKERKLYYMIHDIYSACQECYSHDGIFWLQYGRFLEKDNDLDGALHCFRKGLGLYDSFQIRHALGQLLLKKYSVDGCINENELNEGIRVLQNEIDTRGVTDAYSYNALCDGLLKVLKEKGKDSDLEEIIKDCINKGLKYHRNDKRFMDMVKRYISIYPYVRLSD